jgi:hypothetical protein|nr:MAG TPA: hypothetical protein [Caudoviricetes sp.]
MEFCFENTILDTESSLDRQWRNMEFLNAIYEQDRDMERYVNECLIKASGNKQAINEMTVLNEGTFFDKVKGFFNKIKNFFKKIFTKFSAALSGVFAEQKKYIDKYNFIITKCKWNAGEVSEVKDRFAGVPRIFDMVDNVDSACMLQDMTNYCDEKADGNIEGKKVFLDVNTFSSADAINAATVTEKLDVGAARDKVYDLFSKSQYWSTLKNFDSYKQTDSNNNADMAATMTAWFNGSVDDTSWDATFVDNNFQTIINVSYAGQSYLNKLEKIVNNVTKKMDDLDKSMETYVKAQQDKIQKAITSGAEKTKQEEKDAAAKVDAAKTDATTEEPAETKEESTYFWNGYNSYLNEIKTTNPTSSTNGGSSSSTNTQKPTNMTNTGSVETQKAVDANSKLQQQSGPKVNGTIKDVNDNNTTEGKVTDDVSKKANTLLENEIWNRQVVLNEMTNVASTIVRKAFDSFKGANSDFFALIKAHVQWYLSNPGAEKLDENKATRTRVLSMNAGENVEKTESNGNNTETSSSSDKNKQQRIAQIRKELVDLRMSLSSVSGKEQDDVLKQIGTRENELHELGAK